jgi:DNA-3-methyladenine glycosylase II
MKRALPPTPLTAKTLAQGVAFLSGVDRDLARINTALGPPPMWARKAGFPTLVYIILEQQVSLSSAKAAFNRLKQVAPRVTPENFLRLNDAALRKIGFSRQKTEYCRGLATSMLKRKVDLAALKSMDDPSARSTLMAIKGIGRWTADIYLLRALRRPDIWPVGDLALATAMQELKGLPVRPIPTELERLALPWQPWRAVAARLLWQYYLSRRHSADR